MHTCEAGEQSTENLAPGRLLQSPESWTLLWAPVLQRPAVLRGLRRPTGGCARHRVGITSTPAQGRMTCPVLQGGDRRERGAHCSPTLAPTDLAYPTTDDLTSCTRSLLYPLLFANITVSSSCPTLNRINLPTRSPSMIFVKVRHSSHKHWSGDGL